jgi:hypothetical protein
MTDSSDSLTNAPKLSPLDIIWQRSTIRYRIIWRGMAILAGLGLFSWLKTAGGVDWFWWIFPWQFPISIPMAQFVAFSLSALTYRPRRQGDNQTTVNLGQTLIALGIAMLLGMALNCAFPTSIMGSLYSSFLGLCFALFLLLLEAIGYGFFRFTNRNQRLRILVMRWWWLTGLIFIFPGGLLFPLMMMRLIRLQREENFLDRWVRTYRQRIGYGIAIGYGLLAIYNHMPGDIAPQAIMEFWSDRIGYSRSMTPPGDRFFGTDGQCQGLNSYYLTSALKASRMEGGYSYTLWESSNAAANFRIETKNGFIILKNAHLQPAQSPKGDVFNYRTDHPLGIPILTDSCKIHQEF